MAVKGKGLSRREEHSLQTRQALVATATKLFARQGYAATPIEEIVRAARVTRGALYHHFADGKRSLFEAVYHEEEARMVASVGERMAGEADPWRQARVGIEVFLGHCLSPTYRQVVLLDGPSVLGWFTCREHIRHYSYSLVERLVTALIEAGELEALDLTALTPVLMGALWEGALTVANAPRDRAQEARRAMEDVLYRVLQGLQPLPRRPPSRR
jgi:AcrR family transcriptional regulator